MQAQPFTRTFGVGAADYANIDVTAPFVVSSADVVHTCRMIAGGAAFPELRSAKLPGGAVNVGRAGHAAVVFEPAAALARA